MKNFLLIVGFIATSMQSSAQVDTGIVVKANDTTKVSVKKLTTIKKKLALDSIYEIQTQDTARIIDTLLPQPSTANYLDSIKKVQSDSAVLAKSGSKKHLIDSFYLKILDNPFLRSHTKPAYFVINERARNSKEEIFYFLLILLFFLAFIKLFFSSYILNVFKLLFQPTFRQKQTREQLLQSNVPSLLLNLFFIFSAGAYIAFVLEYYQLVTINFWPALFYSMAALFIVYIGKFIFLSFSGWVFNSTEAAETYIFIVYLINKILGVILVPFILIIAFSFNNITNIIIIISIVVVLLLFLYRYIVCFAPVIREMKVSAFHFFLYVLATEITPLMLICKTLIIYLAKSTYF